MRSSDIVVRPSGIWNSRAPLNNYIGERRELSRATCIMTLALSALHHDASQEGKERSGRQFLERVSKNNRVAGEAWLDYRRSFDRPAVGKHPQPRVPELAVDSAKAIYDVREMTVIRLASLFEAYAQCWALNYLLGSLETQKKWSEAEYELARMFHPLLGKGYLPGWPQIVAAFPMLRDGLSRIPHLFHHPGDGSPVNEPLFEDINAFSVISFWRSYRNLSIHTSRVVTRRFFERYEFFFQRMMQEVKSPAKLVPGKRIPLHDYTHSQMAAVQYRAAIWMNDRLSELTIDRRGHAEAPNPRLTTWFEKLPSSPPLLLEGDHENSWLWISDTAFRERLSHEEGWRLPVSAHNI
jgi:hypothetical protein